MNEIIYQATIPLNPRTKKNNQQILINGKTGKPFIAQNARYKLYEQDAGWFLKKLPEPISEPVNVKCVFYRDSERKVDLNNLLEAITDILVRYKVILDDNYRIVAGHDGSRVLVDKENPRTEIIITKMEK